MDGYPLLKEANLIGLRSTILTARAQAFVVKFGAYSTPMRPVVLGRREKAASFFLPARFLKNLAKIADYIIDAAHYGDQDGSAGSRQLDRRPKRVTADKRSEFRPESSGCTWH